MRKNLKLCVRVTIDTEEMRKEGLCNLDTVIESVKSTIKIDDEFYKKTELYLKSILCPDSGAGLREKSAAGEGNAGIQTLSLDPSSGSAIVFRGVTKDVDEAS